MEESEQAHPQQIATWIEGMQEGLRHAAVCGTLLSHVVTLPEAQQEKLLNELESLRKLGRRWSELHPDEV